MSLEDNEFKTQPFEKPWKREDAPMPNHKSDIAGHIPTAGAYVDVDLTKLEIRTFVLDMSGQAGFAANESGWVYVDSTGGVHQEHLNTT